MTQMNDNISETDKIKWFCYGVITGAIIIFIDVCLSVYYGNN